MAETRPRLSRRVLRTVILLLAMAAGTLAVVIYSDALAVKLVQTAIDIAGNDGRLKITVDGLSGCLASGLRAGKIRFSRRGPSLEVSIKNPHLQINFDRLLTAGVLSLSGKTGHIEVTGLDGIWLPMQNVPAFYGAACFAGLPTGCEVHEFSIDSLSIRPLASMPGQIEVRSFSITPTENAGEQQLALQMAGFWQRRQLASGSVDGLLRQKQSRFAGKVTLCLAGQQISSELCLQQKRRKNEISGYIASSSIDIAAISRWLSPLWQDIVPVGFDGRLDCTGSWVYNRELGFLGNLSGACRNLRVVALGFYFAVAELNGHWKLFDGNLIFSDTGSLFAGFPATFSGQVDTILSPNRNWRLNFNCPVIDFASLTSRLPWGLNYSLALPTLSGTATLALALTGRTPELACRVSTAGLAVQDQDGERLVTGQAGYLQSGHGTSTLDLGFSVLSARVVPPIFKRLQGSHGTLAQRLPAGGPYVFDWVLAGSSLGHQQFSGHLSAAMQQFAQVNGSWKAGLGHLNAGLVNAADSGRFALNGVTFLDLLLAR